MDKKWFLSRREIVGTAAAAVIARTPLLNVDSASAQDDPANCAPIGTQLVQFKSNKDLPVRLRKSAFDLSKTEVDRLKSAYSALRKLAKDHPEDPRGWLRQGTVHCWYCGGGTNGKEGEEIHGSWFFFPWHRAFLYFHERILCKLTGDETLALPYWDWDSQSRQSFPPIYGNPNDPSNPLFDMLRSAKPNTAISNQVVSAGVLNRTMNAPSSNLFLGSQNGAAGAMENTPHGPVHIWTGDTSLHSASNDMGVLGTAAQDPVFFAHHGNIDRLWGVWLGLSPNHKNFTDVAWLTHSWQFFDENSVWTDISVNDVLDPVGSLRYDYEQPTKKPIWTFTPRNAFATVASAREFEATEPMVFTKESIAPVSLGTEPVTREVSLPEANKRAFSRLTVASPAQWVLHVRGIEVPGNQQTMFNVFINLPSATTSTSTDEQNFVGTVTVLAKQKEKPLTQNAAVNAAFDVTDLLGGVRDAEQLSVTLVPVTSEGTSTVPQATFKQISIEHI